MFHTFDSEVAEMFHDANIATLFQNLCYWIIHNKTNDRNKKTIEIDGIFVDRYFTFNSIQAFMRQFPYFSKKQIETYLNKLKDRRLIAKGNFNEKGFDRTSWYCLVDEQHWMKKYLGETGKAATSQVNSTSYIPGQDSAVPQHYDSENISEDLPSVEEDSRFIETSYNSPENCETDQSSSGNLQSFHFPKRGNAFLQNGKSTSPNGEMHFSKTGNPFPQTGKPIPDINSYLIPNLKPNYKQNTAAAVRSTLCMLDHTLVLDAEFYTAAADFLNFHCLGEEYLRWFYAYLKKSKHITNLPGYFFKVFFKPVYVERFKAQEVQQQKNRPKESEYTCLVCGSTTRLVETDASCSCCSAPVNPSVSEIARYKALFELDEKTKEQYLCARSKALRTGGNVVEKLQELDRQFGIVS